MFGNNGRFGQWGQLGSAYNNSLTLMEKIRLLREMVSDLHENEVEINSRLDELTNFINTRFEKYVSDKLDEMVANGTLEVLLNTTMYQNFVNSLTDSLMNDNHSLLEGENLLELPYIQSRTSVYDFNVANFSGKRSLNISTTNYETSTDENKDFAVILNEVIVNGDKLRIKFKAYPTVSNKQMRVRLAYGSGQLVSLGTANKWNDIEFVMDFSSLTSNANYLYFDLGSTYDLHLADLSFEVDTNKVDMVANSFQEVNQQLDILPTTINNSDGAVSKLIEIAQTYQLNIGNMVYGNSYTAFDNSVQQVASKWEMDCSSFVNLIIHGIEYSKSKYSSVNNIGNPLLFQGMNPYKYRYANNMGKYAYEKGYTFKPNADFSNVQAGDVLFFSWTNGSGAGDTPVEARKTAFMQIDHVAIYLNKKNDSRYSTMQYYPNATTVFYDADASYMSQCVLVARFPLANIENPVSYDNLVLNGGTTHTAIDNADINIYRLTKALRKGQYYSIFIKGTITTSQGYFIVQVNNNVVYSGFGQLNPYNGIVEIRFPYLLDIASRDLKISIGGPTGVSRNGQIDWITMYEGFVRNKQNFEQAINYATVNDFALDSALVNDLDSELNPYYKYFVEGNKIFLSLSLPFKTTRTGNLTIGTIPANTIITTQRIPINMIDEENNTINGILQINPSGTVVIINYSTIAPWRSALCNGVVFRE